MGDPLSVAASISGLIALAVELYTALDDFISNVRDAPSLAQTIQSEIKTFRNSLHALHRVLQDPAFCRNKRASLIPADYVFVSFTDAVLVFSQLEANVLPLTRFTEFGVVARMQWTRKKVRLNELVARLQWQKHTLVLQLNILRCASDIEAERDRQVLDTLICGRRGKDRDMERRLELVENQLSVQLNASICDRSSVISSKTTNSDGLTIRAGNSTPSDRPQSSIGTHQHAFEDLLNSSWVYRRNQNREEDMSMRSSVLQLSAWSILSDMSLANISVIAVMSLPVQVQELSNGGWYSTTHENVYGGIDDQFEVVSDLSSADGAIGDEEYDTDEEFSTTWGKSVSNESNTDLLPQHNDVVAGLRSSMDEFRTSLMMPLLAARFSMLRDQDDPIAMLDTAGDGSVGEDLGPESDGPSDHDRGGEQAVAPADSNVHDRDAPTPELPQPSSNLQSFIDQVIGQNAEMMQRLRDSVTKLDVDEIDSSWQSAEQAEWNRRGKRPSSDVNRQDRWEFVPRPVDKKSVHFNEDIDKYPKEPSESPSVAPADSSLHDRETLEPKLDQVNPRRWNFFQRQHQKNDKAKQMSEQVQTQENVETPGYALHSIEDLDNMYPNLDLENDYWWTEVLSRSQTTKQQETTRLTEQSDTWLF